MRKIEAISPTSLKLWETDREAFFRRYMSDNRLPREPQTDAMAVGSAFDAFVKASLARLFCEPSPEFELDALLESQVEEGVRDVARQRGQHLMNLYVSCGAYDELCEMLCKSKEAPRLEFKVTRTVGGVPLLGKPDCWFSLDGINVILDWKVNGFMSSTPTSPRPRYKMCRDTWGYEMHKPTRGGACGPHKLYEEMDFGSVKIGKHWMEDVDKSWADQIAIYGWMMGVDPGSEDFVTCIDQLVCKPCSDIFPLVRVAQHRCRVSAFWQFSLMTRLQSCWGAIQNDHIFDDVSKEESQARCALLDEVTFDSDDEFWAMCQAKGTLDD